MAITITNTLALTAVHNLERNQASIQTSLERLSTGYRINSAADDPAGLIASESLRSEIASTNAAIGNAQQADQVLATADGALSEVSNMLISLQGLVTASANSAGLSQDQINANQLQVDSIIQTIDRLTGDTTFAGTPLLNGAFAYQTSAGPNASSLRGINIYSAQVPPGGETINVQVLASAQHAQLIAHMQGGSLTSAVALTLAGNSGTVNVSFAAGTRASAIAFSINQYSDSTGVTASANATDVAFSTVGYGAAQFVSVQSNSASFQTQDAVGSLTSQSHGIDARVTLNGQLANADGLSISSHTGAANLSFQLDPTLNTAGSTAQFSITGGGATFNIGPQIDAASSLSIGLGNLGTDELGFTLDPVSSVGYALSDLLTNGKASLSSGKLDVSQQIVTGAIESVSTTRARIGAAREYDIQSTINSLNVKVENLSSAESQIRDTDFAAETANLTRSQILEQSSQFALSAAEQNQKTILTLLGQ